MNSVLVVEQPVTKRQIIRKWILRLAFLLAILVPLIFMAAALGAKFGVWNWQFGLGTLTRKVAPWAMGLSLLFGLISLLLAILVRPRKGFFVAVLAILIPVAALVQSKSVTKTAAQLPLIHDITTDTQNPPTFTAAIIDERAKTVGVNTLDYVGKKDLREKKLVSVLQSRDYPEIGPLIMSDDKDVVFGEAKQVALQMGWDIISEDVAAGKIEATETTFWYGFKDDIVIRVRPSEGGGSILDIRSVSRVGASDLGANAARIKTFLKLMRVN